MPKTKITGCSAACKLAAVLFLLGMAWRWLPVSQAASLAASPASAAGSMPSMTNEALDRDADLRVLMKTLLFYLRDRMQSSNKVPSSTRLALLQQAQLASLRPHHHHGGTNNPTNSAEDATLLVPAASPDFEDPDRMDFHDSDKRQFDDYGHMRFGKRGQQFDDYGHMRFGRSLSKMAAKSLNADDVDSSHKQ